MQQPRPIEPRDLRFDVSDEAPGETPRFWHGGGRAITRFFDNLSLFFPAGESFFIASVKAHKDLVEDEQLQRDVRAFYAQEGHHRREHRRYNDFLEGQGLGVRAMEREIDVVLAIAGRFPKRFQLAITCALEHFTALLAHALLADERLLEGADPELGELWRWHAAEENEHKAVAFDVFVVASGSYLERIGAMVLATVVFWAMVLGQQIRLMRADGTLCSYDEWRSLGRFLFVDPGGILALWPHYLDYYRPSFHPWDHDNSAVVNAWIEGYAGSQPDAP